MRIKENQAAAKLFRDLAPGTVFRPEGCRELCLKLKYPGTGPNTVMLGCGSLATERLEAAVEVVEGAFVVGAE